jgi:hypothetical protein
LSGFVVGIVLAFIYREKGPQRPKYQYEIEKEMGIEPPDFEGMYWEKVRQLEEAQKAKEEAENHEEPIKVVYHFKPTKENSSSPEN